MVAIPFFGNRLTWQKLTRLADSHPLGTMKAEDFSPADWFVFVVGDCPA
jgi:hypothetical protein